MYITEEWGGASEFPNANGEFEHIQETTYKVDGAKRPSEQPSTSRTTPHTPTPAPTQHEEFGAFRNFNLPGYDLFFSVRLNFKMSNKIDYIFENNNIRIKFFSRENFRVLPPSRKNSQCSKNSKNTPFHTYCHVTPDLIPSAGHREREEVRRWKAHR